MFDINTAQVGDQVLVSVKGQEVTAIIDKIAPHTINWNLFQVYVTTDKPVAVWNSEDVRTGFCVVFDITGNSDKVTKILA